MAEVKIFDADISKLVFNEKNPRQITKKSFEELKRKMQKRPKFIEAREVVIDENNVILGGHQRVRAAQSLGHDTIRVKQVIGWTQEEKDDFMIDDNISDGDWDMDALGNWWDENEEAQKIIDSHTYTHDYFGDERERTYKSTNLDQFDNTRAENKYQFPELMGSDATPDKLIGFNEAKSTTDYNVGVHFFIDDYQFERLWNQPKNYTKLLAKFECVVTPDFSLYLDMPLAMKIWNIYRSRMIGQILEDAGCEVIPTLSWAGPETYDFCFDGLPKESTYAVSTVGVMRDEESKKLWVAGMNEAIKQLKPKRILLYGPNIDFDWHDIEVTKYGARSFGGV